MHVKRQTVPKSWPVPRKGTKYLIRCHERRNGLPLLIILRDMLKLGRNRKEVKKILNLGFVSVNDKVRKDEKFSVLPFDIIAIKDKRYELGFSDKGKFVLKETTKTERILKIVGKRILRGKKVQLNLIYGKNIISEEKANTGDSVVLKENKILKIIHLKEGKKAIIFSGKYKGKEGKIEKIEDKIAVLSSKTEKINVPIKNIMVIE